MLLIIIIILLVCGLGGGLVGHASWGANNMWAGPGIGLGTVLIILLILFLLGVLR